MQLCLAVSFSDPPISRQAVSYRKLLLVSIDVTRNSSPLQKADDSSLTRSVVGINDLLSAISANEIERVSDMKRILQLGFLVLMLFNRSFVGAENIVVSLVTPSAAYMDHFVAIEKGY